MLSIIKIEQKRTEVGEWILVRICITQIWFSLQKGAMPVEKERQRVTSDMTIEERWEYYREKIADFTIMSDIFARNLLKEKQCTEYLLETILGEENITVLEQTLQVDYKNLQGRSAILDCVARDQKNRIMNVEIQKENEGATPKRARYYSGLIDMNILNSGQDFDKLPEKYIIFITRDDVLKMNLPIYDIQRKIGDTKKAFGDEEHILYVNSRIQNDTKLGKLMHDLHCKNADDMYSSILADRVRILKETPEGVESMCKEMDEIYHWGIINGEKRGQEKGEKMIILLFEKLMQEGRMDDCQRMVKDTTYRKQLLEEWNIS